MYRDIIGIAGLFIIIALFILLRSSEKKHPEKYKKISKKQAVLYVVLTMPFLLVLFILLNSVLDSVWNIMAPI